VNEETLKDDENDTLADDEMKEGLKPQTMSFNV
jgi:hypothetical protein